MRKELALLAFGIGTLGALHDVRASEPERISPVLAPTSTPRIVFEATPLPLRIADKIQPGEKIIGIDFTSGSPVPIKK